MYHVPKDSVLTDTGRLSRRDLTVLCRECSFLSPFVQRICMPPNPDNGNCIDRSDPIHPGIYPLYLTLYRGQHLGMCCSSNSQARTFADEEKSYTSTHTPHSPRSLTSTTRSAASSFAQSYRSARSWASSKLSSLTAASWRSRYTGRDTSSVGRTPPATATTIMTIMTNTTAMTPSTATTR